MADDDPLAMFEAWYAEARQREPDVPNAMALTTVGADGRPSVRMVLMKEAGPDGIAFFTNRNSRKAREIDANAWAAVAFHWKSLERQVIAEGPVRRLDDASSDAYFATRPRGSQIGAWASDQDQPIASREGLEARVAEAERRFAGGPVDRPPFWGGYVILPVRWEFWQGRSDRIHDRLEFRANRAGWDGRRLQP